MRTPVDPKKQALDAQLPADDDFALPTPQPCTDDVCEACQ